MRKRESCKRHGYANSILLVPIQTKTIQKALRAMALKLEDFISSTYYKIARKLPKGMKLLESVFIPTSNNWDDVPKRIRMHKDVVGLHCNVLVGICIDDIENEGDPREKKYSRGGRWKWAALNMDTGHGVMHIQSRSQQSGRRTTFDLSKEGQETERSNKEAAARRRAEDRVEDKGLANGTLCLVAGYGQYGGGGYYPHVTTIEEARARHAKDPAYMELWQGRNGVWHLQQHRYTHEERMRQGLKT